MARQCLRLPQPSALCLLAQSCLLAASCKIEDAFHHYHQPDNKHSVQVKSELLIENYDKDNNLLPAYKVLLESYPQQSVDHLHQELTVNSATPEAAISSLLISCLTLSPFLCRSRLENISRFIKLQIMLNAQIGGYLLELAKHFFSYMRLCVAVNAH